MTRPLRHFAYKLGDKLGKDVDEIMSWSLSKFYEYMAFYITENPEWLERYKEENMTKEERTKRLLNFLSAGNEKGKK